MEIKAKPETKLWTKRIILYAVIFMGGWYAPEVKNAIIPPTDPKIVALEEERQRLAMHTVHTAVLGVPLLDEFRNGDAMYNYFPDGHLEYPLTFTCGCKHRKQRALAPIKTLDLEGNVYQVKHSPISDDHDNLWFLTAEVKPETTLTVPETNGN